MKELFALSGNLEKILQFDGEINGAEKDYALFYIYYFHSFVQYFILYSKYVYNMFWNSMILYFLINYTLLINLYIFQKKFYNIVWYTNLYNLDNIRLR